MVSTRRLTLLDGMILVAATACGLAVIRGSIPGVLHVLPTSPLVPPLVPRPALDILILILAAWPLPAMWTLALLAMRLRRPRPAWRRLARQPGVMACCAAAFAVTFNVLLLAALSLKVGVFADFLLITALPVGLAVAVAWGTLLISGRWPPVGDGFDRAGRWFGAYWLAMVPLSFLVAVAVMR
jgi:hypothetical protein